jgi:site-specific recombinase XerD
MTCRDKENPMIKGQCSPLLVEYRRECVRNAHQPSSIDKRMNLLIRTERGVGKPLIEATVIDLRGWLDAHRLHPRTIYSYISHWASFWRWALLEEHCHVDPTIRLTRPKVRIGLPRPISTPDLAHLLDVAPSAELRAMIFLAGHAGLRCMEIAGIDGPEIMDHREPPVVVVMHGKGDRQRIVPMGSELVQALRIHGIPRSGPLFRKPDGDRYPAWGISHLLRAHMHGCGVDASAHQLRHAYATAVYRKSGGDLRMTQELLGHASPSTTSIYVAWSQERAAKVVDGLYD